MKSEMTKEKKKKKKKVVVVVWILTTSNFIPLMKVFTVQALAMKRTPIIMQRIRESN